MRGCNAQAVGGGVAGDTSKRQMARDTGGNWAMTLSIHPSMHLFIYSTSIYLVNRTKVRACGSVGYNEEGLQLSRADAMGGGERL